MCRNHRRSGLICNIDVTAFASVMFVLLYMFMFMSQPHGMYSQNHWPPVDAARVGHLISMRGADREDALVVGITRYGQVFFRADPVSVDQLSGKIREGVRQGAERKVYIRADARAKYGWVKEVLDSVQSSGVEKIGFLVEPRRTPNPGP
jgi:biopolymer transport protein TolR